MVPPAIAMAAADRSAAGAATNNATPAGHHAAADTVRERLVVRPRGIVRRPSIK